jgi:hypothetical protein
MRHIYGFAIVPALLVVELDRTRRKKLESIQIMSIVSLAARYDAWEKLHAMVPELGPLHTYINPDIEICHFLDVMVFFVAIA